MIRVNGAAVSARGANMIPMETLEGRYVEVTCYTMMALLVVFLGLRA